MTKTKKKRQKKLKTHKIIDEEIWNENTCQMLYSLLYDLLNNNNNNNVNLYEAPKSKKVTRRRSLIEQMCFSSLLNRLQSFTARTTSCVTVDDAVELGVRTVASPGFGARCTGRGAEGAEGGTGDGVWRGGCAPSPEKQKNFWIFISKWWLLVHSG